MDVLLLIILAVASLLLILYLIRAIDNLGSLDIKNLKTNDDIKHNTQKNKEKEDNNKDKKQQNDKSESKSLDDLLKRLREINRVAEELDKKFENVERNKQQEKATQQQGHIDRNFQIAMKNLGITQTATREDVRMAFKKMAKKYHPDVVGGNKEIFIIIKKSYDYAMKKIK